MFQKLLETKIKQCNRRELKFWDLWKIKQGEINWDFAILAVDVHMKKITQLFMFAPLRASPGGHLTKMIFNPQTTEQSNQSTLSGWKYGFVEGHSFLVLIC